MRKFRSYILSSLRMLIRPVLWLAASFQGNDGRASGKKLTAAFLTAVAACYSFKVDDKYSLYAFIAMLVAILMMWSIITSNNIITFTRALKNNLRKEGEE